MNCEDRIKSVVFELDNANARTEVPPVLMAAGEKFFVTEGACNPTCVFVVALLLLGSGSNGPDVTLTVLPNEVTPDWIAPCTVTVLVSFTASPPTLHGNELQAPFIVPKVKLVGVSVIVTSVPGSGPLLSTVTK